MSAVELRTLPWSWYTDPAVLQLERERIFRRSWQYVGHEGDVPEPGSFAATSVGDVPVVLVRDKEDTLRAFLNVCRHRGLARVRGLGEARDAPVPVPRVDVRARRPTHHRAAREQGGRDRQGRARARSSPPRDLGAAPLRQPGRGCGAARRLPRRHPRARRGRGDRPRRAALPPALGVRARLQLEGLRGELPRVLPLPDRAPRVLRRHGREPRRVPPRGQRRAHDAAHARPDASRAVRTTRRARSSAASSTSCSPAR